MLKRGVKRRDHKKSARTVRPRDWRHYISLKVPEWTDAGNSRVIKSSIHSKQITHFSSLPPQEIFLDRANRRISSLWYARQRRSWGAVGETIQPTLFPSLASQSLAYGVYTMERRLEDSFLELLACPTEILTFGSVPETSKTIPHSITLFTTHSAGSQFLPTKGASQ